MASSAVRPVLVPLRVLSFNIRYENPNDGQNNWEMRFLQVGDFLANNKLDVIGLQEVKLAQMMDLIGLMPEYDHVGVGRDDGKEAGEFCPLFFRKDRFNVLRSGTFWLSATPDKPSRGWDAACNRIATWAILQDKATLRSVIVLNTHLDHIGAQSRVNAVELIKERLGRMTNGTPVIVTGDFNVSDADACYQRMRTGIFALQDTYKGVKTKGPKGTWHDFGRLPDDPSRKIDYIFVSDNIKVKSAYIVDSSLGKGFYLSDHNALAAHILY